MVKSICKRFNEIFLYDADKKCAKIEIEQRKGERNEFQMNDKFSYSHFVY